MNRNKILEKILNSSKYRGIYRPTVERIVDELEGRYPEKELEKAVRNKMHQVWGAYVKKLNLGKLGQTFSNCIKLEKNKVFFAVTVNTPTNLHQFLNTNLFTFKNNAPISCCVVSSLMGRYTIYFK